MPTEEMRNLQAPGDKWPGWGWGGTHTWSYDPTYSENGGLWEWVALDTAHMGRCIQRACQVGAQVHLRSGGGITGPRPAQGAQPGHRGLCDGFTAPSLSLPVEPR